MIDLKLLEDKLDAALAQETPQSLTNWLNSKRLSNKSGVVANFYSKFIKEMNINSMLYDWHINESKNTKPGKIQVFFC